MGFRKADRTLIGVKITAEKHQPVAQYTLAMRALTEADSVFGLFGIGKMRDLNALEIIPVHCLSVIGNSSAEMDDVITIETMFLPACSGKQHYLI